MSAFESDELIVWQRVCSLRWDRCMTTWNSNFKWLSLFAKWFGLIHTWNRVFFYSFRNTESSWKFRQRKLYTHMICGPVAATVGLLMICGNTLTNIVSFQYCIHYRYRLVFLICICPPVNIHCHELYYALRVSVCWCLNRWTHTRAHAFIHYFTHTHMRAHFD